MSVEVTTSVQDIYIGLDDINDEEVVELLKDNDINEISVDINDIDIDVNLDDFCEDDIIEHLDGLGYDVINRSSQTNFYTLNTDFDTSMYHIGRIKELLQRHCYDNRFLRLMLEEITMMPMGSDVDAVLAKLKEMCS